MNRSHFRPIRTPARATLIPCRTPARNTPTTSPYAPQAIALRRAGLSRRQIRDRLHLHNNDILNRLLEGVPAPDWTRRPNAKDDLRARARELRKQGLTYDRIQVELGCSKSLISLWVRDLPKPPARTREEASAIARRGCASTYTSTSPPTWRPPSNSGPT
ncbi:hypothetical protein Sgleb_44910 [Streptomyces glebosus]|uniref:Uncharacterized protein n=1 Tax=Streptomyces glebosus TaxID=249580 RepID=A0A640SZV7_9ACTN|nr:hypothetical protein Sgleb_44910 [Streptomyces glebosus]GHG91208.1 hypothetical protein GCM10010513_74660 [Streptomyces glebosus]